MKIFKTKFGYVLLAVWIAAIAICAAGYFLVLAPQTAQAKQLDTDIQAKIQEIANSSKVPTLEENRTLLDNIDRLAEFVIMPAKASLIPIEIENIANKAGLKSITSDRSSSESYSEIKNCDKIMEGRIQVKFNATFPQFADFLNRLERNTPIIFVDKFTIKPATREKTENLHEFDMVLAYFVTTENLDLEKYRQAYNELQEIKKTDSKTDK